MFKALIAEAKYLLENAELPAGHTLKVVRHGRDYSVHTPHGTHVLKHETRNSGDIDRIAEKHLPSGFGAGGVATHRMSIRHDMPNSNDKLDQDTIHVMHPRDLAAHGIHGNQLSQDHLDSIHQAWQEGKRLHPIDVDVTHDDKWHIEDGNHRLHAAAQLNKPVAVRFRKTGPKWQPQSGSRNISDRIITANSKKP